MTQPVWNTPANSIGSFPAEIPTSFQLSASAVQPATTVTYKIISGSLPAGLFMNESGLIYGTPKVVYTLTTMNFVVRVTDNLQNIRDRTFSISITGTATPSFTIPSGSLLNIQDSLWVELPILYSNPVSTNEVSIRLIQGSLPIGLEINSKGLIRGYPAPPTYDINVESVSTTVTSTTTGSNQLTCFSTDGFEVGRPIVFSGVVFGGVTTSAIYYVHSIIDEYHFTIAGVFGGDAIYVSTAEGVMTATLPSVSVGQPTIRTYTFSLKLESPLGSDIETYSITVINQNTPIAQGGPGRPANTRVPTIVNTRPASYNIVGDVNNYSYYILPPHSEITGATYSLSESAYMGQFTSDNYFSFKVLGLDFDGATLEYIFFNLPLGLTGDPVTGWITGYPAIADDSINQYYFSVAVRKVSNPAIVSSLFNFSFRVSNDIEGNVYWETDTNLGIIYNGTISNKYVTANAKFTDGRELALQYRVVDGSLPPNLTLLNNGEITGVVANQPTEVMLSPATNTNFKFTIEAYSPIYSVIRSAKEFSLDVYQEYDKPTDILYVKCTPDIDDRNLLQSLLNSEELIPSDYLYRPSDVYFGKAQNVTYVHAYGIYASQIEEYVAAVTTNHYWRRITLGELKTAIARDENGDIIYEVVYSQVIDNLVNPEGISVSPRIYWPRPINLNLGSWYTNRTDIYSSFVNINNQAYYTSLSPGYARTLYPNSLENMRNKVADSLGQVLNSSLMPLWMTSQQLDGSTLGYTPAWVICYTKPGYSEIIKNNIENKWIDPLGNSYRLNNINFKIDRFSVDKSITYNYNNTFSPPSWIGLPSATPTPDPLDSQDFYVLFPRKTILPDKTQY